MKTFCFLLLLVFVALIPAQQKYKIIIDEKSEKQMLVGEISRSAFQDTSYSWWFNSEYENYNPSKIILDSISNKIKDVDITVILGTWCSDSRREVPRLFKILDSLGYPSNKVKLIAVDRNKKDLSGETDSLLIELVPTFIFYREGKELGRIVEAPAESLEKDINKIVWKD
ncbi:MAG: thioredoxin family protein [Ignavibacteriales bacterium]|nr:thioredoxin family protein [Ignavibacteriales bacterium]